MCDSLVCWLGCLFYCCHVGNIRFDHRNHEQTTGPSGACQSMTKILSKGMPSSLTVKPRSSSLVLGRVSGLSALSIMDGPWKPNQRALPEGSAMELLPQRALPRKRFTLAVPRSLEGTPTRSTARHPPPDLPTSGRRNRNGAAHRAS